MVFIRVDEHVELLVGLDQRIGELQCESEFDVFITRAVDKQQERSRTVAMTEACDAVSTW